MAVAQGRPEAALAALDAAWARHAHRGEAQFIDERRDLHDLRVALPLARGDVPGVGDRARRGARCATSAQGEGVGPAGQARGRPQPALAPSPSLLGPFSLLGPSSSLGPATSEATTPTANTPMMMSRLVVALSSTM